MTQRIAVALLAATLMFDGSVAVSFVAASPLGTVKNQQAGKAYDLRVHRRTHHHYRDACRPIDRPQYYDRPSCYAPAPFFPLLGLGYGSWW